MQIPDPSLEELAQLEPLADRICQIADQDLLIHPENEFIPSPLITLTIYQHVRIFSAGFGGVQGFPSSAALTREGVLIRVLAKIRFLVDFGGSFLAQKTNKLKNEIFKITPAADLLDLGLCEFELPEDISESKCALFFILALYELIRFVDAYNNGYRKKLQLKVKAEQVSSRNSIIDAMVFLNSAQSALEKGMYYQAISSANNKIRDLQSQIAEFSDQEDAIRSRTNENLNSLPTPIGGDSLTPMIWEICNSLESQRKDVKPRVVMLELKKKAQSKAPPLIDEIAGGVRFETGFGDERELNSDALGARIREWRQALAKIRGYSKGVRG